MNATQGAILFGAAVGVVMLALVFLRGSRNHHNHRDERHQPERPDEAQGTYLSERSQTKKPAPRQEAECPDRT
jgi:hypothetical protein